MSAPKWIIVGAFEPELAPFKQWAFSETEEVELFVSGVGSITSAVRLTKFLSAEDRTSCEVVFIGSSGANHSGLALNAMVLARSVQFVDLALLTNRAELPNKQGSGILQASGTLAARLLSANEIGLEDFYSTKGITRDQQLGLEINEICNVAVENLELFGVATACDECRVRWNAISVITNYTNLSGRKDWLANHEAAAARTSAILRSVLCS